MKYDPMSDDPFHIPIEIADDGHVIPDQEWFEGKLYEVFTYFLSTQGPIPRSLATIFLNGIEYGFYIRHRLDGHNPDDNTQD